jgi:subtilisin family serine protease/uncharacterized membrane protein
MSYLPLLQYDSEVEYDQVNTLYQDYERTEISPNPHTMHSLSLVSSYMESEEIRNLRADTPIGIFTEIGLIPSVLMKSELIQPRLDLLLVLIDGETGLWDARIEITDYADVEIRATIPPSGFLIQGTQDELNKISNLQIVRSSHLVPLGLLTDMQFYNLDKDDSVVVEILGWKDSDLIRLNSPGLNLPSSLDEIADMWMYNHTSYRTGSYIGEVNIKDIDEILKYPAISYISPIFDLTTYNNQARIHMGINTVENTYVTGLNGSGQRVAVADTGLDENHGDFGNRIIDVVNVAGDSSTADTNDGHGTHVACTVLGDGSRTSSYTGIAPEAELYFQAMEIDSSAQLSNTGIYGMLNSAYNSGGARFHTNSWGSAVGGSYTTQSEDADDRTSTWDQYWTYQGMTVLFAAGNEGENGISSPGTAKNVITVGGHQNRWDPDQMYPYSSRGPTDDGRIKPDVTGPGDYVRSCLAQEADEASTNIGDSYYIEYSGTSMATPAVAGAAALVREYIMEIAERPSPQGSLVKAMLILGAEDMGIRNIPNNDEGWGRVNLIDTLIPDEDVGIYVDDRSRLSAGQVNEYSFDVTRSGEPLKVVVAWSDYPGSTSSSIQLRNDLDLEVTSPNGEVTYLGNDFSNGKSTTGGPKDNRNNVEVVLIDSAVTGVWTVKVKDASHGGSRTFQPYSIAVRGVNVNDLTPDPTFIGDSFEISTPIPQVGEEVELSISLRNQGAGSFTDVPVSAYANSNPIGNQLITMSPGGSEELTWYWTPVSEDEGDVVISFYIDLNDDLEELSEVNNFISIVVPVSTPGIKVSSESPIVTLGGASDSTTQWDIIITNTALFETNATISVSPPIRTRDNVQFDWPGFFNTTNFNLDASENAPVTLLMSHPAPPPPGLYKMIITGNDVLNNIDSELEIFFDVPVLPQPQVILPSNEIFVSSLIDTKFSFGIKNNGNGAQTYDISLISPAGWNLGFDDIGPFPGSNRGSSGTLMKEDTVSIDVTINSPGVLIEAGSKFIVTLVVDSRVSDDTWSIDIPLIVDVYDKIEITTTSNSENKLLSDGNYQFILDIYNQGNRDITLQPIQRSLPGGWTLSNLEEITILKGQQSQWNMSIAGNGKATSGGLEIRFISDFDFSIDWNITLDVISGAIPVVAFYQVDIPNGQNADTPLGVDFHPVGAPGFDLGWTVTNQGTVSWEPSIIMELPNSDYSSSCSLNPQKIFPGESSRVWCTVVIPMSAESGSEPEITLVMEAGGIETRNTISLLVESVNQVQWSLIQVSDIYAESSSTMYFELQNIGNSVISDRIIVTGPNGWNIRILDGMMVNLQPDEIRSVQIEFTPNNAKDSTIVLDLGGSTESLDYSKEIPIEVKGVVSDNDISSGIILLSSIIVISIMSVSLYYYQQKIPKKQDSKHTHQKKKEEDLLITTQLKNMEYNEKPQNDLKNLERYDEYPGWLWDPDKETWIPDSEHQDIQ